MKLWPTRQKHTEAGPVIDLDAIIAENVAFRFNGKVHKLKPMRLDEFLKFSNAQAELLRNLKDESVILTPQKLAQQYLDVIASVCDTITIDDIKRMEQAQVAALYQLVIDLVTGTVQSDGGQKKSRKRLPIYDSVVLSSSPSAPEILAGHTQKH